MLDGTSQSLDYAFRKPQIDLILRVLIPGRHSPSPAIIPFERPPKKPKHMAHQAQLTLPPPPPGPPIDPDVATDFTLPAPPVLNLNPTLGLWGKGGLLQPTPAKAYEVSENFLDVKAPAPQARSFLRCLVFVRY